MFDTQYSVVDPSEVFSAMTASLLEKQPKPFNPVYAIKPRPQTKLKIGGKPPREIFYRDTLTFMTNLPPAVQPRICTCKYNCNGAPAAFICHSCAIYDPSKAAYYCSECFPARHPWYRVQHIFTEIENDESIAHTLKVAHRMAEMSRYDSEGKGILRKIQNQKPNLAFVADDEKVDNQLREYGRKVVAVKEHILELRARLKRDIEHGDIVPHRRSLISFCYTQSDLDQQLLHIGDTSLPGTQPGTRSGTPRESYAQKHILPALESLRNCPMFASEPLFQSLVESDEPETLHTDSNAVGDKHRRFHLRMPLQRGGTAESTDSMLISPSIDGAPPFREPYGEKGMEPRLAGINEAGASLAEDESVSVSVVESTSSAPTGASTTDTPGRITVQTDTGRIQRKLSGVSYTSVAHSEDIDSVYTTSTHNTKLGAGLSLADSNSANHAHSSSSDISSLSRSTTSIQKVFKGYLARRTVSKMLTTRLMRVFSAEIGRDYYYDRVSGASMWLPPKLLHADHLEELEYHTEQSPAPRLWACKRSLARRSPTSILEKQVAISIIQGFARCICARYRLLQQADAVYRRIWDTDSDNYYYAQVITGTTSWVKSSVYLHASREPPILNKKEIQQQGAKGSSKKVTVKDDKRSPRRNRLT